MVLKVCSSLRAHDHQIILNLKYASKYFLEYRIEVHFSLQFLVLQFKINHQGMVHLTYSDFMQRYQKRFYQKEKAYRVSSYSFRSKNSVY